MGIYAYILKAKKFAEPPFQSKKIAEKVRVLFGPLWVILGHSWATLGHFGSFLAIFGPFRGIFGQICGKFNLFCGSVGVAGLAFRMYASMISLLLLAQGKHHCFII